MTDPAAPAAPELPVRALLARIWRDYLKRRSGLLGVSIVCAALVAGLTAMLAQVLEPAVDGLLVERDPNALVLIPLTIAALALARTVAQLGQAMIVNRIGHRIVGDVQLQLFSSLVRSDLARLRSVHSGAYVSSVLFDANLIREAATTGVVNYTQHALIVIALLAYMAVKDPVLAGIVLLAAPVAGAVMRRFSKRTRKAAAGAMAETSVLSTAVMENLDGVKLVKLENREAAEEARVAEVIARRQRFIVKGANARAAAAPVTEALTMLIVAAILSYAGWRAGQGRMSVGEFTAFIGSLLIASQSLRQLANLQTVMSEGLTAARRLFGSLDVEPEIRDRPGVKALPAGPGAIAFKSVSFAYGADGRPTLENVTLRADPGETVALVGPSGGGKSTILSLIPRFYDVTGGAITVDGKDVREVSLASLRDRMALVTQEPILFDDTIRANIAYSRPDASLEDVVAAAKAAAAHEFIDTLPAGYETTVGEAGGRLSGGQRQRIAIARAFLKNAPILLLDEATSALDTESEIKVQSALERLMAGRTTLLIAHRLSTVRGADRIYVVDQGRIVEQGTHESLVAAGGLYARLARSQDLETLTATG